MKAMVNTSRGLYTQVKVPKDLSFEPLTKQLAAPEYLISDFAKFDKPAQLHLGFQALHAFQTKHQGELPAPYNEQDATEAFRYAEELATQNPSILGEDKLDEKYLKELFYQARGDIPGVVAFYGGLIAQEVLKNCSSKFTLSNNGYTLTPWNHCLQKRNIQETRTTNQLDLDMMDKLPFW